MVKTEIKMKKAKRRRKFIKDKAIINFLLEHMKPIKIDFSKIKIPSFLEFENDERSKGETKTLDFKNCFFIADASRYPKNTI